MTKIEALKQTIENVESGKYNYNWHNFETCNCGVLARTVLGGERLRDHGADEVAGWSSGRNCKSTGLPIPKVFRVLFNAGFTGIELAELEWLGNQAIADKLGWELFFDPGDDISFLGSFDNGDDYTSKHNLLSYLRAWVEILEAETPTYPDITKSIAILPTEEVADKQIQTIGITK